jgi:heat shock protein 5
MQVGIQIVTHSGKSESITIEKGRLSKDDIDRMIREAEEFASEDEAARKRIEALNSLSTFVYGLKTQIGDQEGLGGKLEDEDRKTLLAITKETTEWIDSEGQTASAETLEEKLAEVQAVVNPITSKLYEGGGPGGYGPGPGEDDAHAQEPFSSHDEL